MYFLSTSSHISLSKPFPDVYIRIFQLFFDFSWNLTKACAIILLSAWCWLGYCGYFWLVCIDGWLIFSKICIEQSWKNNFASFRAVKSSEKAYLFQNLCRNFEWNRTSPKRERELGPIFLRYFWSILSGFRCLWSKCGKNKIKNDSYESLLDTWAPS